jgi:hypothetical protein
MKTEAEAVSVMPGIFLIMTNVSEGGIWKS